MDREDNKVLVLFGSPSRKGNTRALVDALVEARGFEAEFVFVNYMNIRGCQSCLYCQSHGGECKVKDEMTSIYDKIKNAQKIEKTNWGFVSKRRGPGIRP